MFSVALCACTTYEAHDDGPLQKKRDTAALHVSTSDIGVFGFILMQKRMMLKACNMRDKHLDADDQLMFERKKLELCQVGAQFPCTLHTESMKPSGS